MFQAIAVLKHEILRVENMHATKDFTGQLATVFIALLLFAGISVQAKERSADKVLVSTPPLHSLVTNLLEGIDTPGLLYRNDGALRDHSVKLQDLARIHQSKMLIWLGAEYEKGLDALIKLDPSIALKGLTLAKTILMHSKADPRHQDRPLVAHDMRFWLDSRLAIMAVRQIAPTLVGLYPEHVERILDNEIALIKRIKKMDFAMRKGLKNSEGVPLHVPQSNILYLAWRYNLKFTHCPQAARLSEGFYTQPGRDLFFVMMKEILVNLKSCQKTQAPGS
jgi:zinc transport system substrate-binding protein